VQVSALNNKRSALGACVIGERVYVCGGYDGITSLATCETYDPCTQLWTMLPSMHRQRSAAGIAVIDARIYSTRTWLFYTSICP
jgi:kelch-like protein 18